MALVRALVELQHTSALPEDVATNTFHFTTADVLDSTLDDIEDALVDFYTAGTTPLYTFFSTEMAQNGHTITYYNLDDPAPRVPMRTDTFNLPGSPNGDPLPGEVALVLSFQATPVSGINQQRQRGRVYVGRLDKDSASAGRPSSALLNSMEAAGQGLLDASTLSLVMSWVVYSPTADAAGDPTPWALVANGWVDNAFDTQRRRGLAPTTRQTFAP